MDPSIDRMTTIRPERPDDIAAVRQLHDRAFGTPAEGELVDRLRAAHKAVLSLVAERDGQVVGHVLFSPVTVASAPPAWRAVGLAPVSVLPEFQRAGIGSALIRAGLEACRQAGYDAVVVLGHVDYYPRFGFARASDHALDNEYGATDAFMVLALRRGALDDIRGLVSYASEFRDVSPAAATPRQHATPQRIRRALPAEREALEALMRRASLQNPGDREALLANPDAIEVPADQIAGGHVIVVEDGGTIQGFAAILPRDDGDAELDALFVEPGTWRRGYGRALVDHGVMMARQRHARALHVIGNPHAERFYLACGFETTGHVATRFGDGLLMRRPV